MSELDLCLEGRKIAARLMQFIQYDNCMVDASNPEYYPLVWVDRIAEIAMPFFILNHPQLLNERDIENICSGFYDDNKKLYGHLPGWQDLDEILNDYFDSPKERITI